MSNLPEAYHFAERIIALRKEQAELGSEIREFYHAAQEAGYPRDAMSGAIRYVLKMQKAAENKQLDMFKLSQDRTEALKEEFVLKLGLAA
jgi:uncharacterized protein (UPF0335 family)